MPDTGTIVNGIMSMSRTAEPTRAPRMSSETNADSDQRSRVSVVICAYTEQRWQDLSDAVNSLRAQSRLPSEIIVVIDHNDKLLARCLADLSNATVVPNRQARGLSGARNTGIHASSGDIIAFLDDDATAEPDWLQRLCTPYANPAVVGVGGHVKPAWLAPRPSWFPDEFLWVVGCSYRGLPTRPQPVRNFIGANMSLRRETLRNAGYFNVEIGQSRGSMLRCDDTELCIRVGQQCEGAILLYEPTAQVNHRVPAARTRFTYFLHRCFTEGIAKAQLSTLVGSAPALESERAYLFKTIPDALRVTAARFILHLDGRAARRGLALTAGVAATALGFAYGNVLKLLVPKETSASA